MQIVRWILILPGAVLLGMVGSLIGGIVAMPFGQTPMDTASAFLGPFAFVGAAGLIAPSHRSKVTVAAASLVAIVAVVSLALSMFTAAEAFDHLSARQKLLTPVAQLLGGLYALFIVPPVLTPGATLDRRWRKIVDLGATVAMLGGLVAVIGLLVPVFGRSWFGVSVGLGVLLIGAVTWLFPFAHLWLRVSRAQRAEAVPEIGGDIAWSDVIRQVFHVREFDRAGTTATADGTVHARTAFTPYGYLLVESPILNQAVRLPIVHRDDFLLATMVFDDPKLAEVLSQEELLVTYAPEHVLPHGLAGGTSHALHYVITPRGTLQRYYEREEGIHLTKPAPEKLFGELVYEGDIRVEVNAEPDL